MDGMQAAILSAKLPHIHKWTEQRIANAKYYDKSLAGISQITIPVVRPDSKHTFHLYVIRAQRRDELVAFLRSKNVETAIHYPVPLPFLEAYTYLNHHPSEFPVSYHFQYQILSLPMYPELTYEMMDYVSAVIKDFYKE